MADVTAAIEQDQIAESLLGDPQPQEQTEEITAGTEAVQQADEVEQGEPLETQSEENADDWLPGEQDKIFADDVYSKYAQRYQLTPEQAADPLLRQLLHDKINSDIYLRQQREQQQFEEPQPEPQQQQQVEQKFPTIEEHLASLNQAARQLTNPQIAQAFANDFMKAFGVTEAAKPETATALANTMTTFGLNLMQTALPQMLMPMLENVMPGISGRFYMGSRADSWDGIRNSNPAYAELPAYGSREFMELCARLDGEYPALTEMGLALERANGGQLYGPSADKFYGTLAKLAVRQATNPQQLLEAAQAGARSARRGEVRRSAGNLGAGQSKGAIQNKSGTSQFQTNSDIFDDDAMAIWQREHGRM